MKTATLRAALRPKLRAGLRQVLPTLLTVVCLFAGRSSLADHYIVPSGSMQPTLVPGDRVLVDKRAYGVRVPFTLIRLTAGDEPARGDVVIFDSPADGTRLIKRIVAIAGDVVQIRAGHVSIDGVPIAGGADSFESFSGRTVELDLHYGGGPDLAPTRVMPGDVFVLGDSRGNSRDSRFFGFVRERDIYARAQRVYYRKEQGIVWLPL